MFTVVLEFGRCSVSGFCRLSDDMFDRSDKVETVFSIGPSPDTAIGRLLEDHPIIKRKKYRVIGRKKYEELLDVHYELLGDSDDDDGEEVFSD